MSAQNLDFDEKLEVSYCIPLSLRDAQVLHALEKIEGRVVPQEPNKRSIAVVCYGPSLEDTWTEIEKCDDIITCSGAHNFLTERKIIPTYHMDVDPRRHKINLMGTPNIKTQYLMASCCHPQMWEHLKGMNVKLWHVFSNEEESNRILPKGEYAITGGSSAGLRAMTLAYLLGYRNIHVFGMDGCVTAASHAGEHPNYVKKTKTVTFNGKEFQTTSSMLYCAKEIPNELNQMPDAKFKFYGKGLAQEIFKKWVPNYRKVKLAYSKPPIISEIHLKRNADLHKENPEYGIGGAKHADTVIKIAEKMVTEQNKFVSILDFGCGKGALAAALPFPIWEYDPAIPGKDTDPRAADLVVCTDVLEHIEPELLDNVLKELKRVTKSIGYFVISIRKASKNYFDGTNAHFIVKDKKWWNTELSKVFKVEKIFEKNLELHVVVSKK
jgi:uncharacterized Rossmann fold enzyme/SAM-dependent methyltransferase